jgi:hypothetical protein
VAVQTICSYLDEESSPKVKLKSPPPAEEEEQLEQEEEEQEEEKEQEQEEEVTRRTDRLQQLLNFALKVICLHFVHSLPTCRYFFSWIFSRRDERQILQ